METPPYTPKIEYSYDNGAQGHQSVFYIGPLFCFHSTHQKSGSGNTFVVNNII